MHIVILGAGVVGFQIASQLISEGKDVVMIDNDPERAKHVSNHLDCIVLNEDGNNLVTLKRAGIERADFFISVTNSDEVNMISCGLVSSEFDVAIKIARVRNLDYSRAKIFEKTFLGIDFIVNSEVETARLIANTVEHGASSEVMLFEKAKVQMRNLVVGSASPFNGRNLLEIRKKINNPFLICGILRGDRVLIPGGYTIIEENDIIYLLADEKDFAALQKKIGVTEQKIEKVVIAGGGKIGALVASYLIEKNKKVTIIDDDYTSCKMLSEKFPEALILNSDISDESIFEEEQLFNYDLIIAATDNQELNILTSIFAKSLGTNRAVALIAKSNYLPIASRLGIDASVSPKISTVDAILKFIRRGNIKSVHSIFDGKAEVIEFSVEEKSSLSSKKIMDIELPPNSLLLSVIRGEETFIPDGQFIIEPDDTIIAIATKNSITQLEDMFLS